MNEKVEIQDKEWKEEGEIPKEKLQKDLSNESTNESKNHFGTNGYPDAINDLAGDFCALGFGIWSVVSGKNRELTNAEKDLLGRRLGAVLVKHNMEAMVREEFALLVALGVTIYRKAKINE